MRSAVYHAAPPAERRAAHRALAAVLDGDRRAWHLAAAAEGVNEEAALALELAAERAGERGSYASQWRAFERAAELSASDGDRARRLLGAAGAASAGGELARAAELVETALPLAADPLVHADLRHEQAAVAAARGLRFSEGVVAEEADGVAQLDRGRAAGLLGLILERRLRSLRTAAAVELAERRAAMCAAESREWRLRTLGDLMCARAVQGDAQGALELAPELLADVERAAEHAPCLIWLERYDDARRTLTSSLERARAEGNPLQIAWRQACIALLELRAGRPAGARAAASEIGPARRAGRRRQRARARPADAGARRPIQGRSEECREQAALADRLGEKREDERARAGARMALGLLALGAGAAEEAIAELEPVARLAERNAVGEPSVLPFAPDLIEAHARLGDVDAGRTALAAFARRAQAVDRRWALAAAARCAGLLADEHEVDALFADALELGTLGASPFEQACTSSVTGSACGG